MQVQSTSKETAGAEPDSRHVYFGEVSREIGEEANIAGTLDEAQLTEGPQADSGEMDKREDTNNLGRPQRTMPAPKRLTYDSPGEPSCVRQVNVSPLEGYSNVECQQHRQYPTYLNFY